MDGLLRLAAANELSATNLRLIAALRSRSWMTPHASHDHSQSESVRSAWKCPQAEHLLLEGFEQLTGL
jgi:hypothetical protein